MEKIQAVFITKENYNDIIVKNNLWTDPNFAHNDSVVQGLEGPFKWMRASQLYNNNEKICDCFSADDIEQGTLGDCYLLSAISALAEFPGRVESIFVTEDKNSAGCYVLKLFICGKFVEIVVDDYFPVDEYNRPSFSGTKSQEIWVMLIEKAWAKLHGSFHVIEGGDSRESLVSLTGAPTDYYTHREQKQDKFWEIIKEADSNNYVMCSGASQETKGIIKHHAYSLINAYEFQHKGKNVRLLQLRNPWGSEEWNGEWSDNDPNWTPELKKSMNQISQNDGIFYMPFKDFFTIFDHTFICKASDEYVHSNLTLEGKKVFVAFQLPTKITGYISVYELTDRLGKVILPNYSLSILKVELYKLENDNVSIVTGGYSNAIGQATLATNLEPGSYVIKISFEKPTKLPWMTLCSYASTIINFAEIKVADIFEVNNEIVSKALGTVGTFDAVGSKKKKRAGAFRKCLSGHKLTWIDNAEEGEEGGYCCEGCNQQYPINNGWWICKECNYQICINCRPRRRKGEKEMGDQNPAENNEMPPEPSSEAPPQPSDEANPAPEGETGLKCLEDHEMKFVGLENPQQLYFCDNCGRAYFGCVKRWYCEICDYDMCPTCSEPPEEFKNQPVPEINTCTRGHNIDLAFTETRTDTFDCSLCNKIGDPKEGRWYCKRCRFSICLICKPSEKITEVNTVVNTMTISCSNGHLLLFSCRPSANGSPLTCAKCKSEVDLDNWRWTCEKCNFNICTHCRKAPEGRRDLICPDMHLLIHTTMTVNDSRFGRCDCCFKAIKYANGRYCCLPCNIEFCNNCISRVVGHPV